MSTALTSYLEHIRANLKLDPGEEREVITELETHIEDRLTELKQAGLTGEEAEQTCIRLLGSSKVIAQQFYEAHNQGTWQQVALACLPHLLFATLFVLNWWHHVAWLFLVFIVVLGMAAYGWRRGGIWAYSPLGYSLIPVLSVGLMLVYLPLAWSLITIPVYLLLASWWLYVLMAHALKRDWLSVSLMFLPVPITVGWYLAVAPGGSPNAETLECAQGLAPYIGSSFLAIALAIAFFLRVRQRPLKIAVLSLSGLITLGTVDLFADGRLSLAAFTILILVMWGLFVIPALIEQRIKRKPTA